MKSITRHRRTTIAQLLRAAAVVLLGAAMVTGGWPSCEPHEDASATDVDPGPTFGAELVVSVVGSGRVTTSAGNISCPASCFARVLLDDAHIDGSAEGVTLTAEASYGSTFAGWKFDEVDLGVRARGPAQCSPMTRKSSMHARPHTNEFIISVDYGETTGTPPRGHEAECADFAKVPLAYAITATFREIMQPTFDAAPPPPSFEILYDPPPGNSGPAREIGVANGFVYWRFESFVGGPESGIATGISSSGRDSTVVEPLSRITAFDVDKHVAFQTANGEVKVIQAGAFSSTTLGVLPTCAALASDTTNVYCRSLGATKSTLWALPISGLSTPSAIYTLPPGRDLAVDETTQKFYFSDDPGGLSGQAIVESTSRNGGGDAGTPVITQLVLNQTSPESLVVGPTHLAWLDNHGGSPVVLQATAGSKSGFGNAFVGIAGTTVRFIAADPSSQSYWVGISNQGNATILEAFPGNSTTTARGFRAGLPSLNGLAVDDQYVYWTADDGRVYRATKFNDLGP